MSCGLIMFDEINNVLLSKSKKGKYSFPKGKIELIDLSKYECARREFLEETGFSGIIYETNKEEILSFNEKGKQITYFSCRMVRRMDWYGQNLQDPDGDIIEARFFQIQEALNLENFSEERKRILLIALEKMGSNYLDEI